MHPKKAASLRTSKRRFLTGVVCSAAATALALLISEAVIRSWTTLWATGYVPSKNEVLAYELQPDYEIRSLKARISSQGMNDRVFASEKPTGVFRIAVVGDSTSFGWQVQPSESFPKVLEDKLNRQGARKFEVINFSVPGYNTGQEHELLTSKVLQFHPDMVILAMCPNDANVGRFLKSLTSKSNFLFAHTYLGHLLAHWADHYFQREGKLLEERLWFRGRILDQHYPDQLLLPTPGLEDAPQQGIDTSDPATVPLRYSDQVGWINVRRHLLAMKEILSARQIPFVVTGYFNDKLRAIVDEINFSASVDFWAEMTEEGVDYASLQLNPDPHMNPKGHEYVAGLIERTIKGAGLVPSK